MVGTLVRVCRCAMSWCNLDLTFDLALVTFTFKIFAVGCGISDAIFVKRISSEIGKLHTCSSLHS